MDFSKCNLECEIVRVSLLDDNSMFRVYTSNISKYPFQIKILEVLPILENNDFFVGIKTERLDTSEVREMKFETFKELYF